MAEVASERLPGPHHGSLTRYGGLLLNIALRISITLLMLDSLVNAGDERYAGKGLPIRNVVIVLVWSMVFPALYFVWKKWRSYPVAYDNLYLSVFWLDMLGNWLDLYNVLRDWDFLPHFHGPGALALNWRSLGRHSVLASTGVANMIHATLEVQEYVGDLLGGTQNVQGAGDTAKDLAAALLGSWTYVIGFHLFHRWRGTAPQPDRP